MKTEKIDHIHIKVDNLESVTTAFEEVLGAKMPTVADFTDDYGMKVSFNPFPNGIEIMEVTDKTKEMASGESNIDRLRRRDLQRTDEGILGMAAKRRYKLLL